MTSDKLKEFIETSREKINNKEFEKVYNDTFLSPSYKGKLTDLFYRCGIEPLDHMSEVPDGYAFESSIKSIVIPSNIKSVGTAAFAYCKSLTSVNIPNSVTSIGTNAFKNCPSLTSITIPNSVKCISEGMFSGCLSLTNITIPNSVTIIGFSVFYGCTSLKSINYRGSKERWNNTIKDTWWKTGSSLETIHCTNGDINL